jgi:outer membrane biosynthesis protein TonB
MKIINKKLTFLFWIFLVLNVIGCNAASDTLKTDQAHGEIADSSQQETENISQDTVASKDNKKEEPPIVENNQNKNNTNEVSKPDNTLSNQTTNKENDKNKPIAKPESPSSQPKTENKGDAKTKATETKKQPSSSNTTTTKKEEKNTVKAPPPEQTVTITIIGSNDLGVILNKAKIAFKEDDTVLDTLLRAAEDNHFDVEYRGSGAMAYIEGIDNLYEFDYGPRSGWNYKLNGTVLNKSSDTVKVKKDDVIEWVYSEDFTEESS